MERNKQTDERIIELFKARHKNLTWELDDDIRKYILKMANPKLIRIIDYHRTVVYNNLVKLYSSYNAEEMLSRTNRNLNSGNSSLEKTIHMKSAELVKLIYCDAIDNVDWTHLSDDAVLNLGVGVALSETDSASGKTTAVKNDWLLSQIPKELKFLDFIRITIKDKEPDERDGQ